MKQGAKKEEVEKRERENARKGVVGEGLVLFRRLIDSEVVGWGSERANGTGSWVLSFLRVWIWGL